MSLQAPPNLNAGRLEAIIAAGCNDWGGVSPVTVDHVNPESPWPQLDSLAAQTRAAGKTLVPRLTVYPHYIEKRAEWLHPGIIASVLKHADASGFARTTTGRRVPDWNPRLLPTRPPCRRCARRPVAAADGTRTGRRSLGEDELTGSSRHAATTASTCCSLRTRHARRAAATRSAMSSTATSTTPTSAPTSAASAPSPRARPTKTCAVRPTCST
jgi:hypothetical protein